MSRWTADDLAEITGGVWEVTPPEEWTMMALAFAGKRPKPRQTLVICRCRTSRHGIGLKRLMKVRNLGGNGDALLTDDTPFGFPADIPRLKVASVHNALASLAAASRANFPGRIVAVTGSSGKSTTCTMIKDLLQAIGSPARSRFGSYNTFDGVNVVVANLANEATAVIEVSHVFLSQPPCGNLRPHVALITNIGEAHLEELVSPQGVAERKSNIFDHMPGGTAVIPRDADNYDYMLERARQAGVVTVSFGTSPEADARLLSYSSTDRLVEAEIFGEKITYQLGTLGRHFAHNSVGALAVVAVLGLDWRRSATVLAASKEIAGRGVALTVEIGNRSFTVIDDAYNANPSSMRAALQMLSERPLGPRGRRIAVLADMLELGPNSEDLHMALADPILQSGIDNMYLVGQHMHALWNILPPRVRGRHFLDAADLWTVLESEISEGDVVLFKGSHGTDLHKVVAALRTSGKRISADPVVEGAPVEAVPPAAACGAAPVRKPHHIDLDSVERTDLMGSIALSAQAAMVLKIQSAGTPQTVFAKNPHASFPPYSLTKLLTTITALNVASQFGCSLNTMLEMVTGDETNGSGRNIRVGDRFSLQDAIANMLLPSSNVTAQVVARTFGQLLLDRAESDASPVPRFLQEMNATAASLGLTDSTFANPHGLYASTQVTTAADMAKLLMDAIGRPAITKVWGRAAYNMTITGPNARTEQIMSSVKMIKDDNVRGGKTGTLPRAAAARIRRSTTYNLVIYSQTTSGTQLASVILDSSSHKSRYADMRHLLSALDAV
jgi:UDP-N-acetylmuramoyl-tripeptide--D-alanyl-D-alanine ligase